MTCVLVEAAKLSMRIYDLETIPSSLLMPIVRYFYQIAGAHEYSIHRKPIRSINWGLGQVNKPRRGFQVQAMVSRSHWVTEIKRKGSFDSAAN